MRAMANLTPDELNELWKQYQPTPLYEMKYMRPISNAESEANEKAAYTLWLSQIDHYRGLAGVIEETYKMYQANQQGQEDFRRLKEHYDQIYHQLNAYYSDIRQAIEKDPSKTYLTANMLMYSPDIPGKVQFTSTRTVPFYGTRAEALAQVWTQIVFAISQVPTPTDVRKKTLEGISEGQLLLILADLFNPERDPSTLEDRRKAKFKEVWEYLEREYPGKHDKEDVQSYFTRIVNRVKDSMTQRVHSVSADPNDVGEFLAL
jgi:hypothetical protein